MHIRRPGAGLEVRYWVSEIISHTAVAKISSKRYNCTVWLEIIHRTPLSSTPGLPIWPRNTATLSRCISPYIQQYCFHQSVLCHIWPVNLVIWSHVYPIFRQRPYHIEHTSSRPITEVKQCWARLVLGWVTAWEHWVLLALIYFL